LLFFCGRVDVVIFDLGDGEVELKRKMEMMKWEETKRPAVVGPSTEKNLTSRLVPLRSVCVDRGLGHHLCTAPTSFQLLWLSRREESQSLDLIGFGTLASSLYLSFFSFPSASVPTGPTKAHTHTGACVHCLVSSFFSPHFPSSGIVSNAVERVRSQKEFFLYT